MNGFQNILAQDDKTMGTKVSFTAAPAKIKRKVKKANPFENLGNDDEMINEEELLKASEKIETKQSCSEKDVMQGAKPCANCNCGLREKYDELQDDERKALEVGNKQSNCGSCYLGDAFRCASCPYRGLPAFEQGDKVKLITKENQ